MNLNEKTFLVVTGASRGIGKTMAIEVAKKLKTGSIIVLLARDLHRLDETKREIVATTTKVLKIYNYSVDFATAEASKFGNIFSETFTAAQVQAGDFERAFIIHNAGTVGDVTKSATNVADITTWTHYYQTNLFGAIALNCVFFEYFAQAAVPKLVVNISSLCGIAPYKSMSYYCSVKAAREMYFRVLAIERNDAVVLNYAPGAIDTDMTVLLQNESTNLELAESFRQQRASNTMLTTQQTAQKFLQILAENKFKSGDHVDYWD